MLPRRFARLRSVLSRRQPDLTVLMDRVNKTHNFSAILRNCDAVGILDVHVVPPNHGLTLHSGTSGGTSKWIDVHEYADAAAAIERIRKDGSQIVAADPGDASVDYREVDYTRPTAIVMGAELYGVSPEALSLADRTLRIPMVGMVRSLNVSVATALVLYEAYRQREAAGLYDASRLTEDEYRRRLFEWAYPELSEELRAQGKDYPDLTGEGALPADDGPSTAENLSSDSSA